MRAELKIIADAARYRIRRLEMANLGAAALLAWALHVPASDAALRLIFLLLLNLFVYLNNDWFDRREDIEAAGRDRPKTAFLAGHEREALRAQVGLAAALGLMGIVVGEGLLWKGLAGGAICVVYSAKLKRIPGLDILAMIAWGIAMPLVVVPPGDLDGWSIAIQLGLFSGVFETIQILRDRQDDARRGVRTTAVALGEVRIRALEIVLLAVSALYAAWMFHPVVAAGPVACIFLPRDDDPRRHWNRVRLFLGITLIAECAIVHLR